MTGMFVRAKKFNQDIGGWDVGNVVNMRSMFHDAEEFDLPLPWGEKTSKVESMQSMFKEASKFNQPSLISWNTASVTEMTQMFSKAY